MAQTKRFHRPLFAAIIAAGSPFFLNTAVQASSVTWLSDTDGLWTTASNWSSNPNLPGAADNVTIDRGAANPIVTLNSGTQTINSLIDNEQLKVTGGILSAGTIQIGSTLTLAGGTLNNASISLVSGGSLVTTSNGGALSSVTINGDLLLNVTSATVLLTGNTSFSAARLSASGSNLLMAPGYTLSSLVTDEGTTSGNHVITLAYGGAGTVTMTPSAIVRLAAGAGGPMFFNDSSPGTLLNNGLVSAEAAGQTFTFQNTSLINNGILQVNAGTMTVAPTNWTNSGTVTGAGGVFNIGGTFNATGGIGAFNTSALTVNITGIITNTGNTITLNAATGSWNMKGGTINNGSINETAGAMLLTTPSGGTLSNVTINGDLLLNVTSATVLLTGNTSFSAARLSASGSNLLMAPGYTLSSLVTDEGTTSGNHVITLAYGGAGTVTMTPSAIVRLAAGAGGPMFFNDSSPGTLLNNGLVSAEAAGQTFTFQNTSLINNGILQVNAGTMTVAPTNWTNSGTVTGAGGVFNIGGTFNATGGIGAFNTSALTVNITGIITNTGNTITLNAATGSWNMKGGTINNGSINETAGAMLLTTPSGGTLSSVTINGDLLLNVTSATVLLTGNTSFSAARLSASGSNLLMAPGYTLSSLVTDEGTTSGNHVITLAYGGAGTVTMTPSAIVRLAAGAGGPMFFNDSSPGTLLNNGLVSAEAAGQTFTFQNTSLINNGILQVNAGTMTVAPTNWTNSGTVTGAGGVFNIGGTFNATGGIGAFNTSALTVNITGIITNTGNTITLNAATGSWNMKGGTINNGSINETAGAMLLTTPSGGTLSNVTINGDLLLNVTSATVLLTGNTSFSAARLSASGSNLLMAPGYTLSSLVTDEGTTSGNHVITLAYGGAGTVTMTPAAIVRLAAGAGGPMFFNDSSPGTLLNNGLVSAEAAGQTFTFQNTSLINNGTVQAIAGSAITINLQATGNGNFIDGSGSTFTTYGLIGNSFTVSGTATIRSIGSNLGTSKLNTLTIANSSGVYSAKLDLTDNHLILESTDPVDKAAKIAALNAAISAGSNGAKWTGNGITSSTAAGDPNHLAVGVFDNALLGLTNFGGTNNVDSNSILVAVAHLGDANRNGVVDIQDLTIVGNNWTATPGHPTNPNNWAQGDLNRDGVVDIQDFTIVANNWQQTSSFSQSVSLLQTDSVNGGLAAAVPEPATLPLLALAAALLHRKSRRSPR